VEVSATGRSGACDRPRRRPPAMADLDMHIHGRWCAELGTHPGPAARVAGRRRRGGGGAEEAGTGGARMGGGGARCPGEGGVGKRES
jgi:hypothetical protein